MMFSGSVFAAVLLKSLAAEDVGSVSGVLTYSGDFTYDYSHIDADTNESLSRILINLNMGFDLSDTFGENAVFNTGLALQRGGSSLFLEDVQGFNNIDAEDITKLYEVYFQYAPLKNGLLKIGRQDANNDFAGPEFAGEFINSSMGFSPTIPLPSYPTPVLSISYQHRVSDKSSAAFGIFDSSSSEETLEEQFLIVQFDHAFDSGVSMKLGYWYDTSFKQGDVYAIAEYQFLNELSITLQYGHGDEATVGLFSHTGISLHKPSLFNEKDMVGLGFTTVNVTSSSENAFEVYYGYQFSENFSVKADVQYLETLGLENQEDNVLITTLRIQGVL